MGSTSDEQRPATGDDVLGVAGDGDLAHRARHLVAGEHPREGDLAGGVPKLGQGERAHAQAREPAGPGVAWNVVGRGGGAGQDELSRVPAVIDAAAHRVPDGRDTLPLVDEASWASAIRDRYSATWCHTSSEESN